jgi:hypothetical protein
MLLIKLNDVIMRNIKNIEKLANNFYKSASIFESLFQGITDPAKSKAKYKMIEDFIKKDIVNKIDLIRPSYYRPRLGYLSLGYLPELIKWVGRGDIQDMPVLIFGFSSDAPEKTEEERKKVIKKYLDPLTKGHPYTIEYKDYSNVIDTSPPEKVEDVIEIDEKGKKVKKTKQVEQVLPPNTKIFIVRF